MFNNRVLWYVFFTKDKVFAVDKKYLHSTQTQISKKEINKFSTIVAYRWRNQKLRFKYFFSLTRQLFNFHPGTWIMFYFSELTIDISNFIVILTCLTPLMHVNRTTAQEDGQDMKGRVLCVKMKIGHLCILLSWYSVDVNRYIDNLCRCWLLDEILNRLLHLRKLPVTISHTFTHTHSYVHRQ
jgi:hypothetical protein